MIKLSEEEAYLHPKCYARGHGSCSRKISKEHFISENLLRQMELNGTVKVCGLACQASEQFNIFGIKHKNLAPKILCEYHNSVLSPLDKTMGEFFEIIGDFDRATSPSSQNPISEQKEFSGDEIEKWMLKCLLGMTVSDNLKESTHLKPECLDILFDKMDWPKGWGLYFKSSDQFYYHSGSFLLETRINPADGLILAADFYIRGLPFMLCLGKPDNPESFGIQHRPKKILFKTHTCEKVIGLTWLVSCGEGIVLSRVGRYDGSPPNWKEWEKDC